MDVCEVSVHVENQRPHFDMFTGERDSFFHGSLVSQHLRSLVLARVVDGSEIDSFISLGRLNYPHLLGVYSLAMAQESGDHYVAVEKFDGTLMGYIDSSDGAFTLVSQLGVADFSDLMRDLLFQIAKGLDFLHANNSFFGGQYEHEVFVVMGGLKTIVKLGVANVGGLRVGNARTIAQNDDRIELGRFVRRLINEFELGPVSHELDFVTNLLIGGIIRSESALMNHPAFWTGERRINFICRLSAQMRGNHFLENAVANTILQSYGHIFPPGLVSATLIDHPLKNGYNRVVDIVRFQRDTTRHINDIGEPHNRTNKSLFFTELGIDQHIRKVCPGLFLNLVRMTQNGGFPMED